MMELNENRNRPREQVSAFRRYRVGWALLCAAVAMILVYLAGGGWGAMVMLPLIVGALVIRSGLVEDYRRRQAEEFQENQ